MRGIAFLVVVKQPRYCFEAAYFLAMCAAEELIERIVRVAQDQNRTGSYPALNPLHQ